MTNRRFVVPVLAAALSAGIAVGIMAWSPWEGSAGTATPAPGASSAAIAPTATPTMAEDHAWACATAWGALTDEQANRYYPEVSQRPLRPDGTAAVPQRLLDLIDHFCFDKPVSYIP